MNRVPCRARAHMGAEKSVGAEKRTCACAQVLSPRGNDMRVWQNHYF